MSTTEVSSTLPKGVMLADDAATFTCPTCGQDKPLTAEHWYNAKKFGDALYVNSCRQDQKAYRKSIAADTGRKPRSRTIKAPKLAEYADLGERGLVPIVPSKPKPKAKSAPKTTKASLEEQLAASLKRIEELEAANAPKSRKRG